MSIIFVVSLAVGWAATFALAYNLNLIPNPFETKDPDDETTLNDHLWVWGGVGVSFALGILFALAATKALRKRLTWALGFIFGFAVVCALLVQLGWVDKG